MEWFTTEPIESKLPERSQHTTPTKCRNVHQIPPPPPPPHFRGINITPVVARVFEKSIYQKLPKQHIEFDLSNTQFAYCAEGSCTDAMLTMQHFILCVLEDPNTRAVEIFRINFFKAFDSLKHSILTEKLKKWPCWNACLVNWYIAFLWKSRQVFNFYQGIAKWMEVIKRHCPKLIYLIFSWTTLESDKSKDTSLTKFAEI